MNGVGLKKAKYLIDSVILIDHLNGLKKATNWLRKNKSLCTISVITRAEVLAGALPPEKLIIEKLLSDFENIIITEQAANLAAEIRQKKKLKLPDAFQLALAQINNLILVTRNTKDFSPTMKFIKVPYKI